jgi:vitamin B12 transporter
MVPSFAVVFRAVSSRGARASAVALLALPLLAGLAFAQSGPGAPPRIDPVVVTATRTPQPLADLVADVTVIGPEEIARSGAQSLTELLQRQPGVEITQNGGPASTSGVFLRGANRGQTLVLIDGVRLGSSTVGATSLEAIPLDLIERIEVLRGPASAVYGSDAIGGVIQVFTRKGTKDLAANASAGYGTYRTGAVAGGVSGANGPLTYALQAGGRRSNGYNAIVDPANFSFNPDRDGYASGNASANAGLSLAPEQELSAQYFYSRQNAQFDAGPGFDARTITTLESWQVGSANRINEWWKSTLTAATGSDDSVSKTAFGDAPYRTIQRQYTWQNELVLSVGALTVGIERRDEHVSGADFAIDERSTTSAFALYRLRAGAQALEANLRYDDVSNYGGRTTGTLAYAYRFSPAWRVAASAGTGFRMPSFNDLYYPGFSNPGLQPETSRSVEGGVYGAGDAGEARWQVRTIGWYNRVLQLIVFGCDASFSCRPDNVDEARLAGVTIGGDLAWRDTTLKASVDLQSPENARTGDLLPRRSRAHGAVSLLQGIGPAQVGVELVASGRRYDDPRNLVPLAGYAIVNLTLEWPLGGGVTLFARGDNVLDRDYQLAAGFSTGGAQFFAGLRWRM